MSMKVKFFLTFCTIHVGFFMLLIASYVDESYEETSGAIYAARSAESSTIGITSSVETMNNFPLDQLDNILKDVLPRGFLEYMDDLPAASRYEDSIVIFLDAHTSANHSFEEVFNSLQEYVFDIDGGGLVLDVSEAKHFLHLFGEVLIVRMDSLITITEMFKEDVGSETLKDLLRNFHAAKQNIRAALGDLVALVQGNRVLPANIELEVDWHNLKNVCHTTHNRIEAFLRYYFFRKDRLVLCRRCLGERCGCRVNRARIRKRFADILLLAAIVALLYEFKDVFFAAKPTTPPTNITSSIAGSANSTTTATSASQSECPSHTGSVLPRSAIVAACIAMLIQWINERWLLTENPMPELTPSIGDVNALRGGLGETRKSIKLALRSIRNQLHES